MIGGGCRLSAAIDIRGAANRSPYGPCVPDGCQKMR